MAKKDEESLKSSATNVILAMSSPQEYHVPASSAKGPGELANFRLPNWMDDEIAAIMEFKSAFGWDSRSALYRWALQYAIDHLNEVIHKKGKGTPKLRDAISKGHAILRMALEEEKQKLFQEIFERYAAIVNSLGYDPESADKRKQILTALRREINDCADPYWRKRYRDEFYQRFGHFMREVELTEFEREND